MRSKEKNNGKVDLTRAKFLIEGVEIFGREGFWNISGEDGKIALIQKTNNSGGGIITPRFSDIHIHLDKTGTSGRIARRATSLFDAISLMDKDKDNWTEEDIYCRANEALEDAWHYGTGSLRTHIDWETQEVPLAWEILNELKSQWKGRLDIELAALCSLELLEQHGEKIAKTLKADNSVLGSFVYRNSQTEKKLKQVFEIAKKWGLLLDFHVDEGLEEGAAGIDIIIELAKAAGMQRKVLCGHACSLSIRNEAEVSEILKKAAEAQVGLVTLPTTNLWLQDNLENRTPRFRGLAPIKEAREAGVLVMIASDNCKDAFYPFGDHDVLSVFKTAVVAAHLNEKKWFDSITTTPAEWMGIRNKIEEGEDATFLRFDLNSIFELMNSQSQKYDVWNKGNIISVCK